MVCLSTNGEQACLVRLHKATILLSFTLILSLEIAFSNELLFAQYSLKETLTLAAMAKLCAIDQVLGYLYDKFGISRGEDSNFGRYRMSI